MTNHVFLYRIKESDDRDCCAYISKKYYVDCSNRAIIEGSCYSGRISPVGYDDVETVLSKEDFNIIAGTDITEEDYNRIISILTSDSGLEFAEKIKEEEHQRIMDDYAMDESDIEEIFDNYTLDYFDRSVVDYVYKDYNEVGEHYVDSVGVPNWVENYIDYEKLGKDLCEEESYVELSDGRIVELSY